MQTETTLLDAVFSPYSEVAENERKRRDGRFALQVCVDTIAYAFNVPLRLALRKKGQDFPATIRSLLGGDIDDRPIRRILKNLKDGAIEGADAQALADVQRFEATRDAILALANGKGVEYIDLNNDQWIRGMLAILPHLERQVWLTEIANPLPVHGLCRMYDPWSLFILMWTAKELFGSDDPSSNYKSALTVEGLNVRTLTTTKFRDREGRLVDCMPVVGPVFVGNESLDHSHLFIERFECFNSRARWGGDASGKPTTEELRDALQSRMPLPEEEIEQRAELCRRSLELLYSIVVPSGFPSSVSREFWEKLATGVAWVAKSAAPLVASPEKEDIPKPRPWFWQRNVAESAVQAARQGEESRWRVIDLENGYSLWAQTGGAEIRLRMERTASQQAEEIGLSHAPVTGKHNDFDSLPAFFNRVRERQSAAWSSQIIAINNLLNRHDLADKSKVPSDHLIEPSEQNPEAGHLLRGFGNQICRYLVSITRADVADLYWADYAQSPPRLVNVGCYARLAEHRAGAGSVESDFHKWAWKHGVDSDCPANLRESSPAQTYRTLVHGGEDPPEGKNITPFPDKQALDMPPGEGECFAYFASYPSPRPRDGLALPLMLNGRPVGVVSLAGLSERQFDRRIFIPLRRAASLLATCMYHQSQLWHMRILNTFFINYQAHSWGESQRKAGEADKHSPHNALETVARCLCNIFLCPVAHLWTRSLANHKRYELSGYNWPEIFAANGTAGAKLSFSYREASSRTPVDSKFAELVIDLHKLKSDEGGNFVQGRFDSSLATTEGFDAQIASSTGTRLGADMLDVSVQDAPYRERIFAARPAGYSLSGIMSFPLLRSTHKTGESGVLEIVGVVTLHDWQRNPTGRDNGDRARPWDRGWRTVVAHMQTYLPYLFEQVEILNNPTVDARRFLIHAGRAEIIGILDSVRRLRSRAEASLSPNGSVRKALASVLSRNFFGREPQIFTDEARNLLQRKFGNVDLVLKDSWDAVQQLTNVERERELVHLANLMHRYRDLSSLSVELTESMKIINLRDTVEAIMAGFRRNLFERGVFKSNDLPGNISLCLPSAWFRIVLGDLFHNAAKYATSGLALNIAWEGRGKEEGDKETWGTLVLSNEGPYDPALDDEQKLLLLGERGSAAVLSQEETYDGRQLGGAGHGIGLWGAKTMCDLMGIGFQFRIEPYADHRRARYSVKLAFPRWMLNVVNPATDPDYA